eukprot:TRINITY_DN7343_c0_g1_i3.p1 TRINITY_DN7343_c0_g1~~TRINITY_DN7343_c0_g1_i3.p1  ORF type:complete len:498 (+),score=78.94 TRINITY_DN7343_c0_g1_i3:119-1612(+)
MADSGVGCDTQATPKKGDVAINEVQRWLDGRRTSFKGLSLIHLPCTDRARETLFFIHGLGGQALQWSRQLLFYYERVNLVAIDLPGHGRSHFSDDKLVEACNTPAILTVLTDLFHHYATDRNVLIGHSFGTSLCCKLYNSLTEADRSRIVSTVLCSPSLATWTSSITLLMLSWVPLWLFNRWREAQAKGGVNSKSVQQFVPDKAAEDIKLSQLQWNRATPSPVFLATARGLQLATVEEYSNLEMPVLLLVGDEDTITPVCDTYAIFHALPHAHGPHVLAGTRHNVTEVTAELLNALTNTFLIKKAKMSYLKHCDIEDSHLDEAPDGKWALKNHAKWKTTPPCSKIMGQTATLGGIIVCKTFRQDDSEHSPKVFKNKLKDVGLIVDISREPPPYMTTDSRLPAYIKLSTVSKEEPSVENVNAFAAVLDKHFNNPLTRHQHVVVHCHYGFNRSGFMACSYLIERRGYDVQAALALFQRSRPPGIKHEHFRQTLVERYLR